MPHKPGMIPNMGDVSAATRVLLGQLTPTTGRRRAPARRKKKRAVAKSRRRRTSNRRAVRGKPARMVKGSAAAKRHMAKLRRMRRKR